MRRKRMSVRQRLRLARSAAVLLGVVLLAGWGLRSRPEHEAAAPVPTDSELVARSLYFRDAGGMVLVPVTRFEAQPAGEPGTAEAAAGSGPAALLREMLTSYPEKGLYSAFPDGTRVVDLQQQKDMANVTLQLPSQALGTRAESLLAGAVVNALTQFPPIRQVKLTLIGPQGPMLERLHLDFTQPLTREAWLNHWSTAGDEAGGSARACTLYWRLPNSAYLAPISSPVTAAPSVATCLKAWAAGPNKERRRYLDPAAPEGWTFKLVHPPDNAAGASAVEIGLPPGFAWDQPAPRAYLSSVIPALVLTLTEQQGVSSVRIVTRGAAPTGYNVDHALSRPMIINRM